MTLRIGTVLVDVTKKHKSISTVGYKSGRFQPIDPNAGRKTDFCASF